MRSFWCGWERREKSTQSLVASSHHAYFHFCAVWLTVDSSFISSPIIISSFLSLLVVIHYLTLSLSEVFYSSKAGEMVWKEINDVFYRQHHLKSLNSPTFSKSTLIFNYFLHPTLSILPFSYLICIHNNYFLWIF